jgi:nucleoside-diphosphate-sugar epimerase
MKVAVTGSMGRIGRAVTTHALEQGHQVIGIDVVARGPETPELNVDKEILQKNFKFVQADLKDPDVVMSVLKAEKCDAVIHLAALLSPGDGLFETHNT